MPSKQWTEIYSGVGGRVVVQPPSIPDTFYFICTDYNSQNTKLYVLLDNLLVYNLKRYLRSSLVTSTDHSFFSWFISISGVQQK